MLVRSVCYLKPKRLLRDFTIKNECRKRLLIQSDPNLLEKLVLDSVYCQLHGLYVVFIRLDFFLCRLPQEWCQPSQDGSVMMRPDKNLQR